MTVNLGARVKLGILDGSHCSKVIPSDYDGMRRIEGDVVQMSLVPGHYSLEQMARSIQDRLRRADLYTDGLVLVFVKVVDMNLAINGAGTKNCAEQSKVGIEI